MKVYHEFPIYGAYRDDLCANTKICLNVHFYTPSIFETQRVTYWLANKQFVISENAGMEELFVKEGGIVYGDYDKLPDLCRKYEKDKKARKEIAELGFKNVQTLDISDYLLDGLK